MVENLHLLHVFPTFSIGGAQLRMTSIMNALGSRASHTVMALDGNYEAATRIQTAVSFRAVQPPAGKGGLCYVPRLLRIIQSVKPAVLLTYNWGAIDAVVAASLGRLCPVIHNECGFGSDEAFALKLRRVLTRRLVLGRIYRTVVVSTTLLKLAIERFRLPPERVQFIRTGVDVERFRPARKFGLRTRFGLSESAVLFGYIGGLRPEKNLELLIRSFGLAGLTNARLLLVGDGPCRQDLELLVKQLGIGERVAFEGQVADAAPYLNALDVFVMSSMTEQTPNALLESMACGLPAIATDAGDTSDILAECGWPAVAARDDLGLYVEKLQAMARQPDLRAQVGAANRRRAVADYSMERMVHEYEALYHAAARRQSLTNHS